MLRKINKTGLDLIKSFEGLSLKAYPDPGTGGHPWTIGYGHTGLDVVPGKVITEAEAEKLLQEDLGRFERAVTALVAVSLTDNQFAALVSFAFNCGAGNFRRSTLLKKVLLQDFSGAAAEFPRWDKAGGKALAGLTRRRLAEQELFLS